MNNGGIIGSDNTPSRSSASGIWTLEEVRYHVIDGNWPLSPLVYYAPTGIQFDASSDQEMQFTPSGVSDKQTWTFSVWFRRFNIGSASYFFTAGTDGNNHQTIYFLSSDTLTFYDYVLGPGYIWQLTTNAVFRDTSKFYHLVVVLDTTNTTSGDRARLYINGERVTSFSTESYPSLNYETTLGVGTTNTHYLADLTGSDFDGVMSDICFVDGQALTPDSFGKTDANGNWVPIDLSGLTFGTNGFWLQDATGIDMSGNGNDWTPVNSPTTVYDTPTPSSDNGTGVFPRINALDIFGAGGGGGTVSNAGLTFQPSSNYQIRRLTHPIPSTGKWAIKFIPTGAMGGSNVITFGIGSLSYSSNGSGGRPSDSMWNSCVAMVELCYENDLEYKISGGSVSEAWNGSTTTSGDEFEFLIDRDAGTVIVKQNGTQLGSTITGLPVDEEFWPYVAQYASTCSIEVDFTPSDTNYKMLHTGNMDDPTVADPSEQFVQTYALGSTVESDIATLRSGWTNYMDVYKSNGQSWFVRFSDYSSYESHFNSTFDEGSETTLTSGSYYDAWSARMDSPYGYTARVSHTNGSATTVTHSLGCSDDALIIATEDGQNWEFVVPEFSSGTAAWINVQTSPSTANIIENIQTNSFDIKSSAASGTYRVIVIPKNDIFSSGSYYGNSSTNGPVVYMGGSLLWATFFGSTSGLWGKSKATNSFNLMDMYFSLPGTDGPYGPYSNAYMDALAIGVKIRGSHAAINTTGINYWWGWKRPFKKANAQ